ncbi:uncharacterized protein [Physcomitrium patens]|uniref:BHLH domain-containing protein n=1 Tax=Physcomitrium patens TaxID=3218 RepID=A0A2K1JW95_PHYPA|nr:uncharacterized protein LOC112288996 isoform X2 [Physcomitrium patens]PNR45805.1 hypothetical protein PHYPA_015576 [Physcomitrium patens]|eukprot:XP_024389618.1 uncharacterized protein LOC112288996 isoform X2 [Physcomitrella patens]
MRKLVALRTLVCFPGRAKIDGSCFCIEIASTSLVSDTEMYRNAIQHFIDESIGPYMYGLAPPSIPATSRNLLRELAGTVLEDVVQTSPAMAISGSQSGLLGSLPLTAAGVVSVELAHENSALLTGITTNATTGLDEAFEAMQYGNIVSSEEPYYHWTMPRSIIPYEDQSALIPFQDMPNNPTSLLDFEMLGQLHSTDGAELSGKELQQRVALERAPKQILPSTTTGYPSSNVFGSSWKGKEILEAENLEFAKKSPESRLLPQRNTYALGRLALSSSQSVLAELPRVDLQTSPAVPSISNLDTQILPSGWSSIHQMPLWHSLRSAFRAFGPLRSSTSSRIRKFPKRQPLIHQWVMRRLPNWETQRGRSQSDQNQRGVGSGNSDATLGNYYNPRSPNSEAHRRAERTRREKSKKKLDTLINIVPIITKRDKISVLSSTIEYIGHLRSRISNLEKEQEAALGATGAKEATTSVAKFRTGKELGSFNTEIAAGPSSSTTTPVVVEGILGGETMNINVETNYHARSLIQLLSILQELDLGIISVASVCENVRFRAAVCVKNSRKSRTTPDSLQATLLRVLEGNCGSE